MNQLTWLIERNCFEDSEPRLIESIKKAGQKFAYLEYIPVVREARFPELEYSRRDAFVFHGSINLGRFLQKKVNSDIILHCNWDNYRCSKYFTYPEIYKELLNNESFFYPYGGIKQVMKKLSMFYPDGFFIRPDSGGKPFSGTAIENVSGLDKFFQQAELYDEVKSDTMCLVAPVRRDIRAEYRCIVIDGKAVTCSRYGKIAEEELGNARNPQIIEATQKLLDSCSYRPDDAFTVDWAVLPSFTYTPHLRLMEFNSFSCAGMYDCDTDKIVKAMQKLIFDEEDDE